MRAVTTGHGVDIVRGFFRRGHCTLDAETQDFHQICEVVAIEVQTVDLFLDQRRAWSASLSRSASERLAGPVWTKSGKSR